MPVTSSVVDVSVARTGASTRRFAGAATAPLVGAGGACKFKRRAVTSGVGAGIVAGTCTAGAAGWSGEANTPADDDKRGPATYANPWLFRAGRSSDASDGSVDMGVVLTPRSVLGADGGGTIAGSARGVSVKT